MAAFLDLARAWLMPGHARNAGAVGAGAPVPAAAEPFGRSPALRLLWQVDRGGGLAASWSAIADAPELWCRPATVLALRNRANARACLAGWH